MGAGAYIGTATSTDSSAQRLTTRATGGAARLGLGFGWTIGRNWNFFVSPASSQARKKEGAPTGMVRFGRRSNEAPRSWSGRRGPRGAVGFFTPLPTAPRFSCPPSIESLPPSSILASTQVVPICVDAPSSGTVPTRACGTSRVHRRGQVSSVCRRRGRPACSEAPKDSNGRATVNGVPDEAGLDVSRLLSRSRVPPCLRRCSRSRASRRGGRHLQQPASGPLRRPTQRMGRSRPGGRSRPQARRLQGPGRLRRSQ